MKESTKASPPVLPIPIGLTATGTRTEFDSMGTIEVPAGRYWGAQTQRSLEHFNISEEHMPIEVFRAFGFLKKAAAMANTRAGTLPGWMGRLIAQVCDEVIEGGLDAEFPLFVWQSGSGTHTNMNVNEVVSNRCNQLLGGKPGTQKPVHPNDHVNKSQSSNDTFPSAMHLAAYRVVLEHTIPSLRRLRDALDAKAQLWADVVKTGRTHLADATPLTVGQQWSGYVGALDDSIADVTQATDGLLHIAMGGTAVGTGSNAPAGFGEEVAAVLSELTGFPIKSAANKFTAQATSDRMVRAHAALKGAAVTLYKIANDLRWLGSGPRTGLMELILPANEPGSSIMPGKVNPTQAEAMMMVCIEIMASDVAVQMAGAEGNFELNAFRPIVIRDYLHSAKTLSGMCDKFREHMIEGIRLNLTKIRGNLDRSVMMVTALSPEIGYAKAAEIAHHAVAHDLTLKQAALALGVDEELLDRVVVPLRMTRPG
jgi:fumarate hydratase class II